MLRPLSYIYVDNISTTAKRICNKLLTITISLHFDQIRYPILNAFGVCIVQFIRVDAIWSLQISSVYLLGQYIISNLGYVICGSYATTLLSHNQIKECVIRIHLKLGIVWCIGGIQSCSTRTSSIYHHGWYINSNPGYIILEQVQFASDVNTSNIRCWWPIIVGNNSIEGNALGSCVLHL